MTSPQEQFRELTRRTQEGFKSLWQQWSESSSELMKRFTSQSLPAAPAVGNPEDVIDAVFDFAENLIQQQRVFAKQMLAAATKAQQTVADAGGDTGIPTSATTPTSASPTGDERDKG